MRTLRGVLGVFMTAGLVFMLAGQASGQSIEQEIEQVKSDLEDARGRELHLIAPTRFETAEKALAEMKDGLVKLRADFAERRWTASRLWGWAQ